jgi:hypothetical protein
MPQPFLSPLFTNFVEGEFSEVQGFPPPRWDYHIADPVKSLSPSRASNRRPDGEWALFTNVVEGVV